MRDRLLDVTWDCHVCGRERPDRNISVRKVRGTLAHGRIDIAANVRYCNDETACTVGAKMVGEEWLEPIGATLVAA